MRYCSDALRVAVLVTLPVVFTLAGCGKSEYGATARVSGKVTYKGKPVPNMLINFMPVGAKEGRPSWGTIDGSGNYKMDEEGDLKGVIMGHHKVYITAPATTIDGGTSKASKKAIAEAAGLTPEEFLELRNKYGSEDTKYEVDVTTDPQVIDIKLE